jgi:imidazoleglycerol phosphate dehydratase HisB
MVWSRFLNDLPKNTSVDMAICAEESQHVKQHFLVEDQIVSFSGENLT